MLLRIAGMTISVSSADPSLVPRAGDPAARFVIDNHRGPADIELTVERAAVMPEPSGTPLFDSGAVWTMADDGGRIRIDCSSAMLGETPYKVAYFDRDFTPGRVLLRAPLLVLRRCRRSRISARRSRRRASPRARARRRAPRLRHHRRGGAGEALRR